MCCATQYKQHSCDDMRTHTHAPLTLVTYKSMLSVMCLHDTQQSCDDKCTHTTRYSRQLKKLREQVSPYTLLHRHA